MSDYRPGSRTRRLRGGAYNLPPGLLEFLPSHTDRAIRTKDGEGEGPDEGEGRKASFPLPSTKAVLAIVPARYVRIPMFCALTGYTEKAIYRKIEDDVWRQGREYHRAPDGNLCIDIEGFYRWVEWGPGTGVEPLKSCIRVTFVWKGKRCRETLELKPTSANITAGKSHVMPFPLAIGTGSKLPTGVDHL